MNSAPTNSFSRPLALIFLLLTGVTAALWLRAPHNPNVALGAQLFLNTPELEPTTTFEVRFDEPMIGQDDVGAEAKPSPLVITPSLRGTFIWLSRRSGVFTPTEAPALATRYDVTLRSGLKTVTGDPLRAALRHEFATPAFRFDANPMWSNWESSETNVTATPGFVLSFNELVATNSARSYVRYRDAAGRTVPAAVAHPHRYEYGYYGSAERPWRERFPLAPILAKATNEMQAKEELLERSRLIVTPVRPLPVSQGWKLVVERGLPSADGVFRTSGTEEFPIGDVQPLTVEFAPESEMNKPRRIRVTFNKRLNVDSITNNLLDRFQIEPPVGHLVASIATPYSWRPSLHLAGDFGLGTNYTVTVKQGFPSQDGIELATDTNETLAFEPLTARAYLPAFSGEQLSGGRRAFEFVTVNCSNLTLTAKRIDAANLVHVLRGYRSYGVSYNTRKATPLDYNLIPGQTTFNTRLIPTPPVDEPQRHAFDWTQLLDGRRHGVALVDAENNPKQIADDAPIAIAQSLVQVTDLGLLWKRSEDETLVWCFSYATGQPVPETTVALVTDENETLAEQTTDAAGLAHFGSAPKAIWLRATKDDDAHAVELSQNQLSTWSWRWRQNWSWDDNSSDEHTKTLLFTDREVYGPGDTVFAKGIMRQLRAGHLELPSLNVLRLDCHDARDTEVFTTNLTLSTLGSLDAAIQLPRTPLGTYTIRIGDTNGAEFASTRFEVAEYKPDAFSVKLTPKPTFAPDERVEFPLSANYYFGKTLSAARVRWRVTVYDEPFRPVSFDEFAFAGSYWPRESEENPASAGTEESAQTLDSGGRATFTSSTVGNQRFPQPRAINAFAEVTDQNQQIITAQASSVLHASAFYLGARLRSTVILTNEPAQLETIAVNADGTPRSAGVPVQATLKKIVYHSVRLQGAGESVSFRNEREEKVITRKTIATLGVQNLGPRWDLAADAEPAEFMAGEPGDYLIELRTQDAAGHDVLTLVPFSVSAEARASFAYRDDVRLELLPNQSSYHAGDTARILIKTPVGGPALVTVERNHVLRHFNVELAGNAPSIEVPLTDDDAPNVFVSVTILRGADKTPRTRKLPEYRYGYCQLLVESRATKLEVAVSSAQRDYLPGEQVDASVVVKDGFGAPVSDAEVTLYAVDEGVLSLTGYKLPAPHELFLRPQSIAVATGISIDNLIPENPDEVRFGNKGFVIGGGGMTDVRKNFAACAFWSAALHTDASGKVTASFKAPDNLTRFRLIAVAHTARQFGGGESSFSINKPVMIEPALPRFANVGDAITLRAVVHNKNNRAGEVRVELALDEHASEAPATNLARVLTLAAGASGSVEFPIRFTEPGTAKWVWRARLTSPEEKPFTDAVESKLDVGWPQPLLRETHLARSSAGLVNLLAGVSPQLLEGRGTIRVRVANTRLIELSESVGHLLHYPYGCAEQTASALLPWILLDDFPDVLPHADGLKRATATEAGITRLLSMQRQDGGLSYWPGGESSRWASAYGGFVLALAPRHHLPVSARARERLAGYLKGSLKGSETLRGDEALAERCMTLLALAELDQPEAGYLEVLFRKRDELSRESRALLALAILESQGSNEMAEQLLAENSSKRAEAEGLFTCPERELALRLAALCHLHPHDPQVATLATELMKSQKDGRWNTTQGNAWSLYALTEYARLVEGTISRARGRLLFQGEETPVELSKEKPVAEFEFKVNPGSSPSLQMACEDGSLFTSASVETRPAQAILPRQDRGFGVTRSYELLGPAGKLREFKDASIGDTVVVSLRVDVHQNSHFVAVDDALPAVFEAVNPSFKTAQTSVDDIATDWFSDFKQLRTDRVQFFRDHLPRGQYVIRYLARVRAAGAVSAPGAKVEEMYHPERFGFTGTGTLATKPTE